MGRGFVGTYMQHKMCGTLCWMNGRGQLFFFGKEVENRVCPTCQVVVQVRDCIPIGHTKHQPDSLHTTSL